MNSAAATAPVPAVEELVLSLPKKPAAALSGERPFLDIERTTPCSAQIRFQPGQR
ncbi:MAG: hypothetical protein ACLU37_01885 [Collinsella sp.]